MNKKKQSRVANMEHIKIVYKNTFYGPLRSPSTIKTICIALKISPRASPTLQSLDRERKQVIVDIDEEIESGIYELLANPDVIYDPTIDTLVLKTNSVKKTKNINNISANEARAYIASNMQRVQQQHQNDSNESGVIEKSGKSVPLHKEEMNACIEALLHLISAIPARYIKYNKVLSSQIEHAMLEVEHLQRNLDVMWKRFESRDKSIRQEYKSIPISIHVAFTQYRIIHVLYETWKTVWRRFSPAIRSFSVTKIQTAHSIDVAEHYMNRLWCWQRIMDANVWDRLKKQLAEHKQKSDLFKKFGSKHFQSESAKRVLEPPELKHGDNPKPWEYLVQAPSSGYTPEDQEEVLTNQKQILKLDEQRVLREFRQLFIDSIVQNEIYHDDEMECLLTELITLHKTMEAPASKVDVTVIYPTMFVRETIRNEFKISWTAEERNGEQKPPMPDKVRLAVSLRQKEVVEKLNFAVHKIAEPNLLAQ